MRPRALWFALVLAVAAASLGTHHSGSSDAAADSYEVWVVDQSDTVADGGGTIYVYDGAKLSGAAAAGAPAEAIDLGGAARDRCIADTGTAPRRPHMLLFNPARSHAVLSFVATGHVLFMDAAARAPIRCLDVGLQAHAAVPAPDGSYVVVANQNGKLLQRINTDYSANVFVLDAAAAIDLAGCTTPNGLPCQDALLRPDNAPICPIVDASSRFAFVTLRGGGMLVVDATRTPMAIVAEYDRDRVHPNGCGGVETGGNMYINSGGGTAANPLEADLYAFPMSGFDGEPNPPNTPAPAVVFSHDDRGFVDSHGAALSKQGRYLWVVDRAANRIVVVDSTAGAVVNEISLAGSVSDDPAPDLIGFSPQGHRAFLSLRGPNPLTANVAGVGNAVGSTPGVGVVRVEQDGRHGTFQAIAPISHVVDGVERADPHGLAVRD